MPPHPRVPPRCEGGEKKIIRRRARYDSRFPGALPAPPRGFDGGLRGHPRAISDRQYRSRARSGAAPARPRPSPPRPVSPPRPRLRSSPLPPLLSFSSILRSRLDRVAASVRRRPRVRRPRVARSDRAPSPRRARALRRREAPGPRGWIQARAARAEAHQVVGARARGASLGGHPPMPMPLVASAQHAFGAPGAPMFGHVSARNAETALFHEFTAGMDAFFSGPAMAPPGAAGVVGVGVGSPDGAAASLADVFTTPLPDLVGDASALARGAAGGHGAHESLFANAALANVCTPGGSAQKKLAASPPARASPRAPAAPVPAALLNSAGGAASLGSLGSPRLPRLRVQAEPQERREHKDARAVQERGARRGERPRGGGGGARRRRGGGGGGGFRGRAAPPPPRSRGLRSGAGPPAIGTHAGALSPHSWLLSVLGSGRRDGGQAAAVRAAVAHAHSAQKGPSDPLAALRPSHGAEREPRRVRFPQRVRVPRGRAQRAEPRSGDRDGRRRERGFREPSADGGGGRGGDASAGDAPRAHRRRRRRARRRRGPRRTRPPRGRRGALPGGLGVRRARLRPRGAPPRRPPPRRRRGSSARARIAAPPTGSRRRGFSFRRSPGANTAPPIARRRTAEASPPGTTRTTRRRRRREIPGRNRNRPVRPQGLPPRRRG